MRKALILLALGAVATAATVSGCSKTAKGVEEDTHKNVEWVGHRF